MPEILWLLIAVVLIMGLAYLFTRYVAGNHSLLSGQGKRDKMLRVVEQTYMGRDRQIVLMQAGDRKPSHPLTKIPRRSLLHRFHQDIYPSLQWISQRILIQFAQV